MLGLAILLGFHLLGMMLQQLLAVPLPGNVIGLLLFCAALFTRIVKVEWVEEAAQFLLKHMMVLFAPIIVGTVAFLPVLGDGVWKAAATLVAGTLVTLAVTGLTCKGLIRNRDEATDVPLRKSVGRGKESEPYHGG